MGAKNRAGTAYDGNAVYDYKRFEEPQKTEIRRVSKKNSAKPKNFSTAKAVIYMLTVGILVSMLLYTQAVRTKLNDDINDWTKKTDALQSVNAGLQLELETRLSLGNIETYAKEKLNMSELKNQQIEYINFDSQNKAEVIEQKAFWEDILNWFKGLLH